MTGERITALAGANGGEALSLRADILAMTDAANAAVMTPKFGGAFSHSRRAALAARIARLNGKNDLALHYGRGMDANDEPIADPSFDGGADAQLSAILAFTDRVATSPKDVTSDDVERLKRAGLDEADIVRLTQLNAFLAYEIRLIDGLQLMGVDA